MGELWKQLTDFDQKKFAGQWVIITEGVLALKVIGSANTEDDLKKKYKKDIDILEYFYVPEIN